jgi:hypothetical protein
MWGWGFEEGRTRVDTSVGRRNGRWLRPPACGCFVSCRHPSVLALSLETINLAENRGTNISNSRRGCCPSGILEAELGAANFKI